MNHVLFKSKNRLKTFVCAIVLLIGLSLTAGCTDIPVALGLGLAGGISYYAFTKVHDGEDKKETKVVEENQQKDIEGSETAVEAVE